MDYDGRVYALASLIVPALWGVAAAQSADVSPWYTLPITDGLHPVRIQPGLAWQRSMATVMAGDGASPYFRDTATAMDVRWRLAWWCSERPKGFTWSLTTGPADFSRAARRF